MSESLNSTSKYSLTANENVSLLKRKTESADGEIIWMLCFLHGTSAEIHEVDMFFIVVILQFSLQRLLVLFLPPAVNTLLVITAHDKHVFC